MKTRITTIVGLLLALFLVGEALAQVPSTVTQQLRLSTGGVTPNYVNHRAITTAGPQPGANGWYAWDQVPTVIPGTNYLLFLNDANEVRRTSPFALAQANFIATVNPLGTGIDFTDPDLLVTASNGLNEPTSNDIELGGPLTHNTNINLSTFDMEWLGSGNFNIGDGVGTLNVNIDPGAGGVVNLANIDPLPTAVTFLLLDGTGNVVSRDLAGIVDADNGLTEAVVAGVSTISLGSAGPTGSGAPLLTDRFVAMNGQDLSFEGDGNFNLGVTGDDLSVNINTGTLGNLTLQGVTLTQNTGALNFLYVDATNNVRRATADLITTDNNPDMYVAISSTGEIVQSPNPLGGIYRGRITGTGTHIYTQAVAGLLAGASVVCTVDNRTGVDGAILVQVTNVAAGTFTVECSENIQGGVTPSYINWIVMNP